MDDTDELNARLITSLGATMSRIAGGRLPSWGQVQSTATVLHLPPETVVFREDEPHDSLYWVVSGLLRLSFQRQADDRTMGFAEPGELISPTLAVPDGWVQAVTEVFGRPRLGLPTILSGVPDHTVRTVTDVTLIRIEHGLVTNLIATHPEWMRVSICVNGYYLAARGARLRELLALSPEERYVTALREDPELVRKLSQRDLALYLGVAPETLSRISARLRLRARTSSD